MKKLLRLISRAFKGGKGKLGHSKLRGRQGEDHVFYTLIRELPPDCIPTEGNCEVVFVISGTATFHYDDSVEEVRAGQVHYCPMNHAHYMENLTDHDLVYLAIVPEHH